MARRPSRLLCASSVFALGVVLAGCGGTNGRIVDPSKVPAALKHTGYSIVFRHGPKPSGFDGAVYGTATNSHGTSVNFAFFFADTDKISEDEPPGLMKLVAGATDEGSTGGESWIAISNAGSGYPSASPTANEQLRIAGKMQVTVEGLAPVALREEGP